MRDSTDPDRPAICFERVSMSHRPAWPTRRRSRRQRPDPLGHPTHPQTCCRGHIGHRSRDAAPRL